MELPRSSPDGEKDIQPSFQWRTWIRSLEDSQETRGISAEEVMVIPEVQTGFGGGEKHMPDVWNTS